MKGLPIVVITGLSGSGKSTVIKVLEDMGYFCLDNMPIVLLPKFLELRISSSSEITKVAVVIDIRGRDFLKEAPGLITRLRSEGYHIEVIFLECSDDVLLRRFSETRRSHPLAKDRPLQEGIRQEREMLAELKAISDKVIDTSLYNVHQLTDLIVQYFSQPSKRRRMHINIQSFGFRYGPPSNADLLVDVRFLPNPYFREELRPLTGEDPKVASYVLDGEEAGEFLRRLWDLMEFLLPRYEKEGKSYLNLAVGCTGGRHRSVVIARELKSLLERNRYAVTLDHRDVGKW